jgi:hypothetical protein
MIFAEPNNGYFFQHLWRDRSLTALPGDQATRTGRYWESRSHPHQRCRSMFWHVLTLFGCPLLRACCLWAEPKKWLVETNWWKSYPSALVWLTRRSCSLCISIMYVYIYIHIHTYYIYICIYVYDIYIYKYVHIYIYTCIYILYIYW